MVLKKKKKGMPNAGNVHSTFEQIQRGKKERYQDFPMPLQSEVFESTASTPGEESLAPLKSPDNGPK